MHHIAYSFIHYISHHFIDDVCFEMYVYLVADLPNARLGFNPPNGAAKLGVYQLVFGAHGRGGRV